jgi:hypothetical protein
MNSAASPANVTQYFEPGEISDYRTAINAATKAIQRTWDAMDSMPSPLYEDEARALGIAALEAIIASQPVTPTAP